MPWPVQGRAKRTCHGFDRVARPIYLVEPAELAEAGVVDQDVDRATGDCRIPKRPCGMGLAQSAITMSTVTPLQLAATASNASRRRAVPGPATAVRV